MIQVITDNSCDLSHERLRELGVLRIDQTINFGDDTYIDGENIDTKQFFEFLETRPETPKTSQPGPFVFEEMFRASLEKGDSVVCIVVGDKLSGTMQSAVMAKNTINDDRIRIVDSKNVCVSVGLLVEIAVQKIKEGTDLDTLCVEMTGLADRVRVYGGLDSLKYMKKGGRLSGAQALVGTMLHFFPIIATRDGLVENVGKAKGKKKLYATMRDFVLADGVDTNYPIIFGEGISNGSLDILKGYIAEHYDISNALVGHIGPVVGTFSGPGVIAIGFISKQKE